MWVWRIDYQDPYLGHLVGWAASQRKAKAALRTAFDEYEGPADTLSGSVTRVKIPTDKSGLIGWLNTNLTTDNG